MTVKAAAGWSAIDCGPLLLLMAIPAQFVELDFYQCADVGIGFMTVEAQS